MMNRKLPWMLLPMLALASCATPAANGTAEDSTVKAQIATTPFIIADMETTIDASKSSGEGELTYSYDIDGDGTFEATPTEGYPGYYSYTFEEPGEMEISVKVEDEKGNSDVASTSFTVYPEDYLSVDKKSELDASIEVNGNKATVEVAGAGIAETTAKLRVYLNGKTAETADALEDIKAYPLGDVPAGEKVTLTATLEGLTPGSYQGTIVAANGPEKNVTFTIR